MAMKLPMTQRAHAAAPPVSAMARPSNVVPQTDCMTARRLLANTLGRSWAEISESQPLDELIEDSLVRETIIMEMEDFLGLEIDRARFCKAKTVQDLAALMAGRFSPPRLLR